MHGGGKQSAARRVAADLRAEILSSSVRYGKRIAGEHELMSRFSVSRQTVREALRELSAQGLVESRRGPAGGAFVAAPDLARMSDMLTNAGAFMSKGDQFTQADVTRAIFEIEAACSRLAIQRRDPAAVEKMRQALAHAALAPNDNLLFYDAFLGFNRALWEASGNPPLVFVMQAFMHALRNIIDQDSTQTDFDNYRGFLLKNDGAILAAIEAGDEAAALRALEDNMAFWLTHAETATK